MLVNVGRALFGASTMKPPEEAELEDNSNNFFQHWMSLHEDVLAYRVSACCPLCQWIPFMQQSNLVYTCPHAVRMRSDIVKTRNNELLMRLIGKESYEREIANIADVPLPENCGSLYDGDDLDTIRETKGQRMRHHLLSHESLAKLFSQTTDISELEAHRISFFITGIDPSGLGVSSQRVSAFAMITMIVMVDGSYYLVRCNQIVTNDPDIAFELWIQHMEEVQACCINDQQRNKHWIVVMENNLCFGAHSLFSFGSKHRDRLPRYLHLLYDRGKMGLWTDHKRKLNYADLLADVVRWKQIFVLQQFLGSDADELHKELRYMRLYRPENRKEIIFTGKDTGRDDIVMALCFCLYVSNQYRISQINNESMPDHMTLKPF